MNQTSQSANPRRRPRRALRPTAVAAAVCAVLALAGPVSAFAAERAPMRNEELHYRWHLGRFFGRLAGLFLPGEGDGVLTFERLNGDIQTELLITSEQARDGEYWRYGARLDAANGEAEEAWSSYRWRGEEKAKREKIDTQGVRDVVSGILAIRRDPPTVPRRMEIWSDGKIYPVVVIPMAEETRTVAGRKIPTRHYQIRGYDMPGGRRWKGSLELWLAEDAASTPVEIHIERNLANLQLELKSLP